MAANQPYKGKKEAGIASYKGGRSRREGGIAASRPYNGCLGRAGHTTPCQPLGLAIQELAPPNAIQFNSEDTAVPYYPILREGSGIQLENSTIQSNIRVGEEVP